MTADSRRFLIDILIQWHIDKLKASGVVTGDIKKLKGEVGALVKDGLKPANEQVGFLGINWKKLTTHAIGTIVVWTSLRNIFMGMISAIKNTVTTMTDLENGMARIRVVSLEEGKGLDTSMQGVREQIESMARQTGEPVSKLTKAFEDLKQANLSVTEAQGAYNTVVKASVGSDSDMSSMAEFLVGVYNTQKQSLDENTTAQEFFNKTGKAAVYTYIQQAVKLEALKEGYAKLAPYTNMISDSTEDLITLIGVLNTLMVTGSKAGLMSANTVLQIIKKKAEISQAFNIQLPKNKPFSLIGFLTQLSHGLKQTEKLSDKESQALAGVFEKRALIVPGILAKNIDILTDSIKKYHKEIENKDYIQEIFNQRMDTTTKQAGRLGQSLKLFVGDLLSEVGVLEDIKDWAERYSNKIDDLYKKRRPEELEPPDASKLERFAKNMHNVLLGDVGSILADEYEKQIEEYKKSRPKDEYAPDASKFEQKVKWARRIWIAMTLAVSSERLWEKEIEDYYTSRYGNLMKQENLKRIHGIEALKTELRLRKSGAEELNKQGNTYIRTKDDIKIIVDKEEQRINILRALGADELKIAQVMKQQLAHTVQGLDIEVKAQKMRKANYDIRLAEIGLSMKEKSIAGSLAISYRGAGMEDRAKIRSFMEWRSQMAGAKEGEVGTAYRVANDYMKSIIEENISSLPQRWQKEIGAEAGAEFNLPMNWTDTNPLPVRIVGNHPSQPIPEGSNPEYNEYLKQINKPNPGHFSKITPPDYNVSNPSTGWGGYTVGANNNLGISSIQSSLGQIQQHQTRMSSAFDNYMTTRDENLGLKYLQELPLFQDTGKKTQANTEGLIFEMFETMKKVMESHKQRNEEDTKVLQKDKLTQLNDNFKEFLKEIRLLNRTTEAQKNHIKENL